MMLIEIENNVSDTVSKSEVSVNNMSITNFPDLNVVFELLDFRKSIFSTMGVN